jgi:hypothetical protein
MGDDTGSNLPPFPSSYRASGLLLHVPKLPSPCGIGDVGLTVRAWWINHQVCARYDQERKGTSAD